MKNLLIVSGIKHRFLFRPAAILSCHLPNIFKFVVNFRFYAAYECGMDPINFILQSSVLSGIKSASCLEFAWLANITFWNKIAFHVDTT